jgi:hypothetical protein
VDLKAIFISKSTCEASILGLILLSLRHLSMNYVTDVRQSTPAMKKLRVIRDAIALELSSKTRA